MRRVVNVVYQVVNVVHRVRGLQGVRPVPLRSVMR